MFLRNQTHPYMHPKQKCRRCPVAAKPVGNAAMVVCNKHQSELLRCFKSSSAHVTFDFCRKGLVSRVMRDLVVHSLAMVPVDKAGILLADIERTIASDTMGRKCLKKISSVLRKHHNMGRVSCKLWKGIGALIDLNE